MILQCLIFALFAAQKVQAHAYSCLEVADNFFDTSFHPSVTYICVVPQEGFTNWEQLKHIKIYEDANVQTVTLYDIASSSTRCLGKLYPTTRWTFQSGLFDLNCDQEFTFMATSQKPQFVLPIKPPVSTYVRHSTLVVPQTGMWIKKVECHGDGDVTFYTGVGVGEIEQRFEMKTWTCDSVPDFIVSFDNVISIEIDETVEDLLIEISSGIDRNPGNLIPYMVSPGDKIAVLTSGRSDDRQNLKGVRNAAAFETIDAIDGKSHDVTADMDITFDWSDSGDVLLKEHFADPLKQYYAGQYQVHFGLTNYFEVHYLPTGLSAAQLGSNSDNIVVEITIAGQGGPPTIPPSTTAQPKTTSRATTVQPAKTTTQSRLSTKATTLGPAKTTNIVQTTTASSKTSSDGPYCSCAVDKFGFPAGWDYNDIWLDIVVILDTSEAMGAAALDDASALIESFISDGVNDFLITDPSAPFYTRVGVIGMADTATVIYDLNMTKADSLQGKVAIKKGVKEINVVDAFDVALRMFTDGYSEARATTRKVIYYMTNSNPGANLTPLNQFKTSQGIIIVDNFLEAGAIELPRLKELASDGYYFTNSNYMEGLQAFCKANCFCNPKRDTYGGSDPAVIASGGCYHASTAGVPFNKAKSTCASEGGIIATVHDDNKGYFLQQLMARASSKSSYSWIGYEKSESGAWEWEDQSTDPYTNWDVDEPSTAAVSKCAYVDTTTAALPWGAGNCQIGFPYICQYTPCSTMEARWMFQALFLLFFVRGSQAYADSCEEVKYRFKSTGFKTSLTYICVITQEGFSNWDQLKKIYLKADEVVSLYDIANSPNHCKEKKSAGLGWTVQDDPITLDCAQEFTFTLSSNLPTFITPIKEENEYTLTGMQSLVVPQTGMWIKTKNCTGKGNVIVSTGVGSDSNEWRIDYQSWPCTDVPDWIVSFDIAITLKMDSGVEYSMVCSSDLGLNSQLVISPGDSIAVLTSGQSDDLQNLIGKDNRAIFKISDEQTYEVSASLQLTFDSKNAGSVVALQESSGGPLTNYSSNGLHLEKFSSSYFEVRYIPKGTEPADIYRSLDTINVGLTIGTEAAAQTTVSTTRKSGSDFCNCAVDKFGFASGWNYNDIWLDVVFVLDMSEAMEDDSLDDAGSLIESFISDGSDDFLITNTTAPFYTRVGVISVADTAEVLYNLNMTKADKVEGKVTVKKGVTAMNFSNSLDAAKKMFDDGLKSKPERTNARQVIYYITDSDPNNALNDFTQFKDSNGVIIVNNFPKNGEKEIAGLEQLASDGYFFADSDYMQGLQAFCRANCFCKPDQEPYGGFDETNMPAGGCYHTAPAGVPFNKAKSVCAEKGGIIATIHDVDKGRFLQQLLAETSTKSDYFWIGYEKSDAGAWQWEDQSTDPYTNWDVNEPSAASVAKCAYVDTSNYNLPWGAGNCQLGFPHVCQYTPCSAGNKDC